jgi:hypothetical protein
MENRLYRIVEGMTAYRVAAMFAAAVCIFFFNGCKSDVERPGGILPADKMVTILTEIYVAEEKVNRLVLPRDSATQVFEIMEQKIYDKTGIADSVFKASFDYYMDRPKEMEAIYSALVDSLQLKEQQAPSQLQRK